MIKRLKSELKLRPTYDEMVGMINEQGDENRPSIETVIDRKATLFRNNQFGSQFDNVDFLGLKQQEENKVKEELRQTQLRQTAIATGTSIGVLSYGGRTPSSAYQSGGSDFLDQMINEEYEQAIRAELETGLNRQMESRNRLVDDARSDLGDVHSQQLPVGIPIHSMASDTANEDDEDLPPLETPTELAEEEEEEEEFEDDDETQVPPQSRKHKETIDYNENIDRWKNKDVSVDDILYQLHLRGIKLTEEQEEEMDKLKIKGKGKSPTKKEYLLNYVERRIQTGKWADEVNDQLLRSRMEEWTQMKKGKGKGVIQKAFESAGSALLEAGKEAVKGAVIDGVVSGAMSLL